jgi:hypothetical protein
MSIYHRLFLGIIFFWLILVPVVNWWKDRQ